MRKSIMLIAAMCMTSVMTFAQKTIRVSTDKTDLVMKVSPKGRLYQVYQVGRVCGFGRIRQPART